MTLQTHALHPLFGVEITGVDITKPIDDRIFAKIRAALDEYSLLLFRSAEMTDERQVAFSEQFGPMLKATSNNPGGGTPFSRQSNLDIATGEKIPADDRRMVYQRANALWHSDSSYRVTPSLCSLLSGRLVPPKGGATEFASMRAAWDALPPGRRQPLDGLVAEHSLFHSRQQVDPSVMSDAQRKETPPVRQAVVRSNPANGRKNLFIGAHASHIIGQPTDKGRVLLVALLDFGTQPQFVYRHDWQADDLIVYDNRCLLHRATPYDTERHRRFLQRVTVAGDGPTAPQDS